MFACVLCDIPMATACVHFCARSLPSELERLKLLGVKPKSVTVAWVDVVIYVGRQGGFAKEPHGVPRDFRRFFGAFVFAAVGAVITTTKQVHDHKIATLERGRN
jgi:hypothetical protein